MLTQSHTEARHMKLTSSAKIDPALRAQLESATAASDSVAAVIKLRPKNRAQASLPPGETQRVTDLILERVRQHVGQKEQDYVVLDMLGAFNLVAPANFVVELLNQPEVASALSADAEESAFIPPRNVKEVDLKVKSARSRGR